MTAGAIPAAAGSRLAAAWPVAGVLLGGYCVHVLISATAGASLHVDEAQYWDWSRSLQWGYYSKPPLIAALVAASTALAGDGEPGVRLLTMACWPAAGAWLAALAHDMATQAARATPPGTAAPDPGRCALAAAVLFSVSPITAWLGLVATTDGPLVLAWSAALWGLWHGAWGRLRLGWLVFGAALAAGVLGKYSMLALLPGAAVWCWRLRGLREGLMPLALACALAALAVLPHLAWSAAQGWPTWQHTADITVRASSAHGGPVGLAVFVAGQLLVAGPLVLVLAWRCRRASAGGPGPLRAATALLLWAAVPLLLAGVWQGWRASVGLNWLAPAHLSLVLAVALQAPRLRLRGVAAQALLLCAALVLPPWLANARADAARWDPWARMRGWPQAFDAIGQRLPPGVPLLVVSDSRTLLAHAAYHWRGRGIERAALAGPHRPAHHYEMACPWHPGLAAGRQVVLLSEGPPGEALRTRLPAMAELAQAPVLRLGGRQHPVIHAWLQAGAPAAGAALEGTCR
jgi:4-amino-4-deoxy-L-arabinose transferase-like glycosyltransferase